MKGAWRGWHHHHNGVTSDQTALRVQTFGQFVANVAIGTPVPWPVCTGSGESRR